MMCIVLSINGVVKELSITTVMKLQTNKCVVKTCFVFSNTSILDQHHFRNVYAKRV